MSGKFVPTTWLLIMRYIDLKDSVETINLDLQKDLKKIDLLNFNGKPN